MDENDIIFLSETHGNISYLENRKKFKSYGNPSFPLFQRHGGLAAYVNDYYAQFINNIRYSKCTISFNISIIPKIFFMGIYVHPTDSHNFDINNFGVIIDEVQF